jgi:predicted RNase H-like nuclease (RuvC/YqgF family)
MRRDVNFVLLYLVVLLLLVLVGLSVYYQHTYAVLRSDYDAAHGALTKRVKALEQENANLSARIAELNTSAVRSEELGERYAEVVKDKEKCEVELAGARETIVSLQKSNYVLGEQVDSFKRLRAELKSAVGSLDTYMIGNLNENYSILRNNTDLLKQISDEMAAIN